MSVFSMQRVRRSFFWPRKLALFIPYFFLYAPYQLMGAALSNGKDDSVGLVFVLLASPFIIYDVMLSARRLHDINKSGWWLLIWLIPFGGFVLIYWFCQDSYPHKNQWGESPKYQPDNGIFLSKVT